MKQTKKILSRNGTQMLSARAAAARLACAPDYISKLCRDGKLSGVLVNGAWLVYGPSLDSFESSREEARAARSEELSALRKKELSGNGFVSKTETPIAVLTLNPFLIKMALASIAVGFIFTASVALTGMLPAAAERSLGAALGTLQSPFFAQQNTGLSFSLPSTTIFGQWFDRLFASRVGFEPDTKPAVQPPPRQEPFPVAAAAPEHVAALAALYATSSNAKVQYAVYPVIERTVEKVVIENGISPELLTSIVRELAAGQDGAIQYNDNGRFAASSTALLWDDKRGAFTVSGALNANALCLRGVCLTKEQLQNLISATASSTP